MLNNLLGLETPFVLAPMDGITDSPFRRLVKSFYCSAVTTEMISSEALVRNQAKTWHKLKWEPEERPITVQLSGHKVEVLAEATAQVSALKPDRIELNLGCSVRRILNSGSGAALLKDLSKLHNIFQAMRASTELPLSIKTRLGWRSSTGNPADNWKPFEDVVKVIQLAHDCGFELATIHGRFVQDGFSSKADWQAISFIKNNSPVPIIGNGDLKTAAQAYQCFCESGVDAVMIGRAAMAKPWIFSEIYNLFWGKEKVFDNLEKYDRLAKYLDNCLSHYGEPRAIFKNRRNLSALIREIPGSVELRKKLVRLNSISAVKELLYEFFYCYGNQLTPVYEG